MKKPTVLRTKAFKAETNFPAEEVREFSEAKILHEIIKAWGAHPKLRIARINVGMGWFAGGKPARTTDSGAYPVRFNPPGTADLVGVIAPHGTLLMIEVKTLTGKQRKAQVTMQKIVQSFGGIYILARSVADVDAALVPIVGAR